jgi:hypothetical protein
MTNKGFPPGYEFRPTTKAKPRPTKASNAEMQEAMGIEGTPIQLDEWGTPILEDDAEEAIPPVPPPPAPKKRPTTQVSQQQLRMGTSQVPQMSQHPIFQKLYGSFGLSKTKKHYLHVEAADGALFKCTMVLLSEELGIYAGQVATDKAVMGGQIAMNAWMRVMVAALSLTAIDDVPLYQVMGVMPISGELEVLQMDPYNPPTRIRKAAAISFADKLMTELSYLAEALFDYYEEKISLDGKIRTSLDRERESTRKYVCPVDGCSIVERLEPQFQEDGMPIPYYCKIHRTELIRTPDSEESSQVPL